MAQIILDSNFEITENDRKKTFAFNQIKFDPDIIEIDNEIAFGKKKKLIKIYSDIFLMEKKSFF